MTRLRVCVSFVLLTLIALLIRREFLAQRSQGRLTACRSNLKNIGTACEMYSADFAGRYPPRIGLLTPKYLRTIPTCPEASRNTYSRSFESCSNPDAYTFYCAGENHPWAGRD